MKNLNSHKSTIFLCIFILIFILSSNFVFGGDKILSVNPRPEYDRNWGSFLVEFGKLGIEGERSSRLSDNLDDYKLVAVGVSTLELDNSERLFEWVKKGNKLVTFFLNDSWVGDDFFPYKIKFSDADPVGIKFINDDSSLLSGLGGKTFKGRAGDVPVDFDKANYKVLAATLEGTPVVLKADYGRGSILIIQFHTSLSNDSELMGRFVKNIAEWSNLSIQIRDYAEDVFERAADHAALTAGVTMPYNWGEGVFMYGLMEAYEHFKKPEYLEAVKNWADKHTKPERLADILDRRAYCGIWGPGTPTVMLYGVTGEEKYLRATKQIWEYIRDEATRTEEGALGHYRDNYQIWVDTLFMVCPTLAKYYKHTGDEAALEDAILQLVLAQKHMQCKWTDLFFHMWDSTDGKTNPDFWGRGNGWVIMSIVDTLEHTPKAHEQYDFLKQVLQKQIKALMRYQAPSGMWRTVVNRPDSYEETSATAMIVYGVAKAMQLDLVEQDYRKELQKAWSALEKQVSDHGAVLGTSAGTGPSYYEGYMTRPVGEYTWGTGAFLMAGAKLHEMKLVSSEKTANYNPPVKADYSEMFEADGKINLGKVRENLYAVMDSFMVRPGPYGVYRLRRTGEPELYATTGVAIARTVMGENFKETLTLEQRQEWVDHINSYAKPDGTYISGIMGHSLFHRNGMVIGALGPLGGKQKYPVQLYEQFDEEHEIIPWLERINWVNQWGGSHYFWGGMHCYSMSTKCTDRWRQLVFDWLDENLDPETGWWRKGVETDFANHLGGGAHIWPIYGHHGRRFPYPKKVIDSIIDNQKEQGNWWTGIGSYLDLDALYGLYYMKSQAPGYRTEDIEKTVDRYAKFFAENYEKLAGRKTVNTHQLLSLAGTAGLLNQHNRRKYYDTVKWSGIFTDLDLYQTDKVEVFDEKKHSFGEPILYRKIEIPKQYLTADFPDVNASKKLLFAGDIRMGSLSGQSPKPDFLVFRAKKKFDSE